MREELILDRTAGIVVATHVSEKAGIIESRRAAERARNWIDLIASRVRHNISSAERTGPY